MRTYLECFSCFLDHGLDIAKKTGLSEGDQRTVINEIAKMIPDFPMDTKPPMMSLKINTMIRGMTGVEDPFAEEKRTSNSLALKAADTVRKAIAESEDPLKRAIEYAIAGNIIDLGATRNLDIQKSMAGLVSGEDRQIAEEDEYCFSYTQFRSELEKARSLLYISDNTGEIVFDMLLIELLRRDYPELEICVALRDRPVINDATLEDAREIGLDKLVCCISSGSPAPGTPLSEVSDTFLQRFHSADLVIAKGQGNYETLSDAPRPVYLLFKVKCPVVARSSGGALGDIMLLRSDNR